MSRSVRMEATIRPLTASKPMCSGAPLAGTVLLDQPFARAAQLQARAVNQQVDRTTGRAGLRRQFQALSPSAEGREIWHRQVNTEQLEDRADQPLGLTQRQMEHTARNVKAVVIARSE